MKSTNNMHHVSNFTAGNSIQSTKLGSSKRVSFQTAVTTKPPIITKSPLPSSMPLPSKAERQPPNKIEYLLSSCESIVRKAKKKGKEKEEGYISKILGVAFVRINHYTLERWDLPGIKVRATPKEFPKRLKKINIEETIKALSSAHIPLVKKNGITLAATFSPSLQQEKDRLKEYASFSLRTNHKKLSPNTIKSPSALEIFFTSFLNTNEKKFGILPFAAIGDPECPHPLFKKHTREFEKYLNEASAKEKFSNLVSKVYPEIFASVTKANKQYKKFFDQKNISTPKTSPFLPFATTSQENHILLVFISDKNPLFCNENIANLLSTAKNIYKSIVCLPSGSRQWPSILNSEYLDEIEKEMKKKSHPYTKENIVKTTTELYLKLEIPEFDMYIHLAVELNKKYGATFDFAYPFQSPIGKEVFLYLIDKHKELLTTFPNAVRLIDTTAVMLAKVPMKIENVKKDAKEEATSSSDEKFTNETYSLLPPSTANNSSAASKEEKTSTVASSLGEERIKNDRLPAPPISTLQTSQLLPLFFNVTITSPIAAAPAAEPPPPSITVKVTSNVT